ncbi:unnamed protein product, partial [Ectocarpus fasciculatus]
LARPRAASRRRRGFDDPGHPWTAGLLDLLPWKPDVLHLHNLHGGWFDLRQLGPLSRRVPTVVTLHDAWLPLSGPHWPMHVEGWDTEALRANHALREEAFSEASLTVVTPSRWMKQVWDASPWSLKVGDAVVIPNGIDLSIFRVEGKRDLPGLEAISPEAWRILSISKFGQEESNSTNTGSFVRLLKELGSQDFFSAWIRLGRPVNAKSRRIDFGNMTLYKLGFMRDRSQLAALYRAAGVLLHPVDEDNFPSVVLEAMACGTAVVASRVGGIPEQFADGLHGRFYSAGDEEDRLKVLHSMLQDSDALAWMGQSAAEHARQHFDRRRMAENYLGLYAELQ